MFVGTSQVEYIFYLQYQYVLQIRARTIIRSTVHAAASVCHPTTAVTTTNTAIMARMKKDVASIRYSRLLVAGAL
jgi:hypothetical protein